MEAADGSKNKALNKPAVNNSRHKKLLQTADGSYTFLVEDVNETYHSKHGAEQESLHVFIHHGLNGTELEKISILEVGLGTGLNVLLTLESAQKRKISYTALEPFPLSNMLVSELCQIQINDQRSSYMERIHLSPIADKFELENGFQFVKLSKGIQDYVGFEEFDLIYFDAFGPNFEPELWTACIMQRCYDLLRSGGIWVSYCAKGEVRRNLIQVGFEVERLPGPPGKREMLRARKK
jgi:tRNA U34 5-methylaminomethyl-2-thiouridine-forming methyltransferase MnmC